MFKKLALLCLFCFSYLHAENSKSNGFAARPAPVHIQQIDEESVRAVLSREIPELTIDSFTLISNSSSNVVAEVNGEWMFRFPRETGTDRLGENIALFKREKWLLDTIAKRVSMPVPYYEYVGKKTLFVGYQKIPGTALSPEEYDQLSDQERESVAEQLAVFLSDLHSCVDVEEARAHGYEERNFPLDNIEEQLSRMGDVAVETMIHEAIACMRENPFVPERIVLQHGDVHAWNVGYDAATKRIQGVFDFSDACIGDYAYDFGQLFTVSPDLARRSSEIYARLKGVKSPLKLAAVECIVRRAYCWLDYLDKDEPSCTQYFVALLKWFVPVWAFLKAEIQEVQEIQAVEAA